jgi:uncharacterized protein YbjT (DUF2867 family)
MPANQSTSSAPADFKADITVVGATGLIGAGFLKMACDNPSMGAVMALTRRKIPGISHAAHIRQEIIDFENLADYRHLLHARTAVCAIGTTIKKAGSQENFRNVDYRLPLNIAALAAETGCKKFILISAVGADPDSSVFYSRVKGELERDIQKLPLRTIHIIRPSILLGDRQEFRFGEEIGKRLIQPLSFLIPARYKPVHADVIASKIRDLIGDDSPGVFFYEGKQIKSYPDGEATFLFRG